MKDKEMDQLLRIKTGNTGKWQLQSSHYNQYEVTPYWMLHTLFQQYQLKKDDTFVDFGCGKGRVLFYVHHLFRIFVSGIEMNEQLYERALRNKENYLKKEKKNKRNVDVQIQITRCFAEQYEIKVNENRFYFFNPFSVHIFTKVVSNILHSVKEQKREVDIILYYPRQEYVDYLEEKTPFSLWKEIKIPGLYEINSNERFLIFRLNTL